MLAVQSSYKQLQSNITWEFFYAKLKVSELADQEGCSLFLDNKAVVWLCFDFCFFNLVSHFVIHLYRNQPSEISLILDGV